MKRITFITGHYGSGKSEFSIHLAIKKQVDMLIDLDIVNPYFRSREQELLLKQHHILLISSPVKEARDGDLPYISKEAFLPSCQKDKKAVYDLGGDGVGAKLLRQFEFDEEEIEFLLCVNVYRERTSTKESIITMMNEIESSSGYQITGIIHNSNFLRDTTIEDIKYGEEIIHKVCEEKKIPVKYTGIYEKIYDSNVTLLGEVIPLKLVLRKDWL